MVCLTHSCQRGTAKKPRKKPRLRGLDTQARKLAVFMMLLVVLLLPVLLMNTPVLLVNTISTSNHQQPHEHQQQRCRFPHLQH